MTAHVSYMVFIAAQQYSLVFQDEEKSKEPRNPTVAPCVLCALCSNVREGPPAIRGEGAFGGHAVVGGRREPGVGSELFVVGQDVPLLPSVAGLPHLAGREPLFLKTSATWRRT